MGVETKNLFTRSFYKYNKNRGNLQNYYEVPLEMAIIYIDVKEVDLERAGVGFPTEATEVEAVAEIFVIKHCCFCGHWSPY